MRIDLHCHTKKVKTGDAYTRNVTKDKFFQKVIEAEVKIIAITNHNQFDYLQYKEFKDVTEGYCDIWPGVELDIIGKADQKGNCKRGHLIVIANPKNVELFNTQVQELVNDEDVNTFQIGVKKVYETLGKCDCIYIPHFHKEPKLSDEDIQELRELLPDSSRLFKETSDYRSLGVFSNFDYSVIIGSDVQDWDKYEISKFADIRLPVQTFEQFCLLAKKDVQIIDTLLNQKRKKEIPVSPYKKVNFKLPFYEDINIIFGQKGTGKTEILESLKKYYIENGIAMESYKGNEKDSDFSKMLKVNDIIATPDKLQLDSMRQQFIDIYNWKEELPTSFEKYISWMETKDNNKNKGRMKITECVHIEEGVRDRKLESDYKYLKEFTESTFEKIDIEKYLDERERTILMLLLGKLCENINDAKMQKWNSDKSIKLTNWSIDKIKAIADKCSDTISKPSSVGFYDFAMGRFKLFENVEEICSTFSVEDKVEKEYLGNLEEKGDIYIQTRYRMLTKESRTDEFKQGITVLRNCKLVIDGIKKAALAENISEEVSKFQEFYDDGIKDIGTFIGVSKETALENGEIYRPSNGERGILLMQKLLDSERDAYILDEPELGMGNSYITSNILPKLTDLAKRRKTVIIATHNANIAVGTLPYISILRTHENGVYKTYVGNPFYDELRNIDDETDTKNWTQESMHTLEGGKTAFYDRKDIYESGKQSD
ncbi:histidinol phosphatase [Megamonas funiformis]|uniref:histidinol phosphatase n=1 Tax=Megamonas funiformis TaxID=437897 RepID=UPI00399B3E2C